MQGWKYHCDLGDPEADIRGWAGRKEVGEILQELCGSGATLGSVFLEYIGLQGVETEPP